AAGHFGCSDAGAFHSALAEVDAAQVRAPEIGVGQIQAAGIEAAQIKAAEVTEGKAWQLRLTTLAFVELLDVFLTQQLVERIVDDSGQIHSSILRRGSAFSIASWLESAP